MYESAICKIVEEIENEILFHISFPRNWILLNIIFI